MPQPGATAEHAGLVMTGGASRGRGRGLATVFVERAESAESTEDSSARSDDARHARTGEVRVVRTGGKTSAKKGG